MGSTGKVWLWGKFQSLGQAWVKLLYTSPQAPIRVADRMSPAFALGRGIRQGCPLSHLLFAIAIEPLAALVRVSTLVRGFQYGALHKKIMLYADDMLLFPMHSLPRVMSIITQFGHY